MTENMKSFMEKASKDKDLVEKINAINKEKKGDENKKAMIDLAKSVGVELKDDDFKTEAKQMSEDELDNVAGGFCFCIIVGFSTKPEAGAGAKDMVMGATACAYIGVGVGGQEY